jgi:hypothetical protein
MANKKARIDVRAFLFGAMKHKKLSQNSCCPEAPGARRSIFSGSQGVKPAHGWMLCRVE